MKIEYNIKENEEGNIITTTDFDLYEIKSIIKVFVYDSTGNQEDFVLKLIHNNKIYLYVEAHTGTDNNDNIENFFYVKLAFGNLEHSDLFHDFYLSHKDISYKEIYKTIYELFLVAVKNYTDNITKNKSRKSELIEVL